MTEDEMAGWHHQLNGHESEQTWGDTEGQGYNKIPQTGWLINNRNLLLPVLEAGNSRSWYQYAWVLGKVLF